MIRFNDTHIFVGHIKQILREFELPRYRNKKWQGTDTPGYYFGKRVRNYTRNLQMKSNAYDSYTHEYLGWYLRFYRDFRGIDLMPLYNCFSERACDNVDLRFSTTTSMVSINSDDASSKTYMLPVQLGKTYTIAMDSELPIEVCCALVGYYQADDQRGIPSLTYKKYNTMSFQSPEVFKTDIIEDLDIGAEEANLKMIIKMPVDNDSSIVILEGDYSGWNSTFLRQEYVSKADKEAELRKYSWKTSSNRFVTNYENTDMRVAHAALNPKTREWDYKEINPSKMAGGDEFKPITPLQLLRINTGVSYPFADRLMEYLTDNVITPDEELTDNVIRAQVVMEMHDTTINMRNDREPVKFDLEGVWEPKMRAIAYDYMQNDKKNGNDKNHDIFGYIDKDVETCFTGTLKTKVRKNGQEIEVITRHTIANEDIYPDMFTDDKEN